MKKIISNLLSLSILVSMAGAPALSLADSSSSVSSTKAEKKAEKKQAKKVKQQEKKNKETARILAKRKESLKRFIDVKLKNLAKKKSKIEDMKNIAADLKTKIYNLIDEAVKKLNEFKAKIDALKTLEEAKQFKKDLNASTRSQRDIIEEMVDSIKTSKAKDKNVEIKERIAEAEKRANDLDAKILVLKNQGKDTSVLNGLMIAARAYIAQAKTALDAGKKELANDLLKKINKVLNNIEEEMADLD